MEFRDFFAGQNDDDRRLDRVIRFFLPDASLSEIYKLIRKGLIKVNDKKTKPDCRVKNGDKISVAAFLIYDKKDPENSEPNGKNPDSTDAIRFGARKNHSKNSRMFMADIDIKEITVFQNEHILILDKSYDIKVHGDENSLDVAVKNYYEEISESDSLSFTPGPLHRLDRKTTGLIAFSLSLKGAKWFSENIQSHKIKKIYMGIVQGKMTETERWEDFIEKAGFESFKTVKISKSQNGTHCKKAVTTAKPVRYGSFDGTEITLVEFDIETGRTHQIRSQSAAHGFPLFGDTAYGGKKIVHADAGKTEEYQKRERDFYLHATKLVLPENDLGLPREIFSEPKDFPAIFC